MIEAIENNEDIICCIKCRREFKKIRSFYSHYTIVHKLNNSEYRKRISEKSKKQWEDLELRKSHSEKIKLKWKSIEFKKNHSEKMKKAWQRPVMRKNHSEKMKLAMKRMLNNPECKNKMVQNALKASRLSPNKSEQFLQQILDELYPNEYKFVGNGEIVIGGFCPDFINCNGKKLIIEFDGDYWHRLQETQEKDLRKLTKYKELGFDTLVIKGSELKNDKEGVRDRIVGFVKNYEKEHYALFV